jgi:hypothetical protein
MRIYLTDGPYGLIAIDTEGKLEVFIPSVGSVVRFEYVWDENKQVPYTVKLKGMRYYRVDPLLALDGNLIYRCEEVYRGAKVCDKCNGKGMTENVCQNCRGSGSERCNLDYKHDCGKCDGRGKITKSCDKCEQVGYIKNIYKDNVKQTFMEI